MNNRVSPKTALLAATLALAALTTHTLRAQAPATQAQTAATGIISITAGRSTVIAPDFDIARIAVTNPNVADATVISPREILIDGKTPGTISLIVWGNGVRSQYDVVVNQPVSALQQQLRELFPGEDIRVTLNEEALTLSGRVSSTNVMLRAEDIAARSNAKMKVINLLELPGGNESQQVLLQVRFAEVDRTAARELGVSLFTGVNGSGDWVGRVTTQQFAAPAFEAREGVLTFSDFLNLFLFNTKHSVGGVLKALQQNGHLQSLAEPNLVAFNGKEASFLAGGEVPVPITQGGAAVGTVTVVYKEFGIRLSFTPTIAGDMIKMHVKPEVSTLDFSNGVSLGGFRIPSLIVRRAETDVELRDGQSFAIAGLMNNISQTVGQGIPLLSSLPVIGALFKSKAERQEKTELLVLITPHLVRPLDPDEVPSLPTDAERFLPDASEIGARPGGALDAPFTPPARPNRP